MAYDRLPYIHVAAYLRARGFREIVADDVSSTFVHDQLDVDVLLPKRTEYRDYARAMRSLVRALREIEQRPEELIVRSIMSVTSDVVRVRAVGHELRDGTVPFDAFLSLGEAARGMMQAAACAAQEPRKAYANRKSTLVVDYLASLRFGQTEHGSYVLTVLSGVPPRFPPSQASLPTIEPIDEEPYERRVTSTLLGGLRHVVSAASAFAATGSVVQFEESVPFGVSADLCEAVAALPRRADRVTVAVDWAGTRPAPARAGVVLTPDMIDVVAQAAKYLRAREPEEAFVARGLVKKLERTGDERSGTAQVLAFVRGDIRRVTFEVVGDQWDSVHLALASRDVVVVEGELVKTGPHFQLLHPRNLRIESDG